MLKGMRIERFGTVRFVSKVGSLAPRDAVAVPFGIGGEACLVIKIEGVPAPWKSGMLGSAIQKPNGMADLACRVDARNEGKSGAVVHRNREYATFSVGVDTL